MKKRTLAVLITVIAVSCGLLGHKIGYAQNAASPPEVNRLITQQIDECPDAEARLDEVTFPPGASVPAHRHPGHVFVYVLEGAIRSQLEDNAPSIYRAGDAFYEPTHGLHAVIENPSDTHPAKILVVMIAESDQPSLLLEQ